MQIEVNVALKYFFNFPTDSLLQIEAAATEFQIVQHAKIEVPDAEHFVRMPSHDYIGERIWIRKSGELIVNYNSIIDIIREDIDISKLPAILPHQLPGDTIQYLLDSNYCPASKFQNFVMDEFGNLEGGARIIAMRDWIADKLIYTIGVSDRHTNALDTFVERRGVCRDYAHLLISLARASSIPARFASVYAPNVKPQDFHAVVEVYLEGGWYLLDATLMSKPSQTAIIGIGRDASDVGFLTSYGFGFLNYQQVNVTEA